MNSGAGRDTNPRGNEASAMRGVGRNRFGLPLHELPLKRTAGGISKTTQARRAAGKAFDYPHS